MAEIRSASGPGDRQTKIETVSKTLEEINGRLDQMMAELKSIKGIVRDIVERVLR